MRSHSLGLIAASLLALITSACASAPSSVRQPAAATGAILDTSKPPVNRSGYTGLSFSVKATTTPDGKYHAGYSQVAGVETGSPAQKAGFAVGDVMVAVNGADTLDAAALFFAAKKRYVVRVRRGDEEQELILVPAPHR